MKYGLTLAAVAVAALVGAIVLTRHDGQAAAVAFRPEAAAATASALHKVIVVDPTKPTTSPVVVERVCGTSPNCRNGEGGIDVVVLVSGTLPVTPMAATVLTDTDCMPDQYGISHCLNTLRLADRTLIKVRHDHNMRLFPCLTQGEQVQIVMPPAG